MRLGEMDFEPVEERDLRKWDYGTIRESGRHPLRFLWLEHIRRDFARNVFELESHLLEITSRGTILLDGVPLKDKEDQKRGSDLFRMSVFS